MYTDTVRLAIDMVEKVVEARKQYMLAISEAHEMVTRIAEMQTREMEEEADGWQT